MIYRMLMDDRAAIASLINDWVVSRDAGDFDRLRNIWTPDGKMNATWFSGSADEFVANSRRMFGAPVPAVLHMLGAISVDVRGNRAVSQAKMTISARGTVHDTACEVTCWGRFYDFWQKDGDVWKLAERFVIYERDRLDALNGAPFPKLDAAVLAKYPPGYQHLAYMQQANGATVIAGLPGLTGAAVELLYANGGRWLGV
jgi:ketosteroid isomerase-like protein